MSIYKYISIVFRYISRIKKKEEDPSYKVDWANNANLPSPYAILVRLFTLIDKPFAQPRCGEFICSCLHSIAELIDPACVEVLQDNLPVLAKFLQGNNH